MKKTADFTCSDCGKTQTVSSDEKSPDCCGKPMTPTEPLPVCEMAASAEHSRLEEDNEPCDDGRGGSNR